MACNPNNPKAQDPNYSCNPATNRWVKKKGTVVKTNKTGNCNPTNPKAQDPIYECNPTTNRWVKKKPINKEKEKVALVTMIVEKVKNMLTKTKTKDKTKTKTKNKTKSKDKTKTKSKDKTNEKTWDNECKKMEQECPMETDLSGDTWCSLNEKDVFHFKDNNKHFCYGVLEIFSIIHMGFTARDTSYEVPPLRFQLPRDSYDRTPFTKKFFVEFMKHIKKHKQVPTQPEVCYFLKHFENFYNDPVIQPFLTQKDPNKVPLSNAIDQFLLRFREIDINFHTSEWYWLQGKQPRNMKKYLFER